MTSGQALVSVIIPCYNQGHYLDEAVSSVLVQTYQNWEIIIINDGSTDENTREILKYYHQPKTRIIHTENQGVCQARNTGIAVAKGKYILPLDADDKIASTYIEKAVNILEANQNIGIVYCETQLFGDTKSHSRSSSLPSILLGQDKLPEILLYNRIHNSALYHKIDWELVKGYNSNMEHGFEDYDLWLGILATGKQAYLIPEYLYFWRRQAGSRTTVANQNVIDCYTQLFRNHQQLYTENIDTVFQHIIELRELYRKVNCRQQTKDKKIQLQLQKSQKKLQRAKAEIAAMQASKFWQLRDKVLQVKQSILSPRELFNQSTNNHNSPISGETTPQNLASPMQVTYQSIYNQENVVKHYSEAKALQLPEIRLLEKLKEQLPKLKMLDIGVGAGRTTLYFSPLVQEYYGVDFAEALVNHCQARFADYAPQAQFRVCDVTDMSMFADDYFDVVLFSFNGLDNLELIPRIKGLKEMKRVCKPGGLVFFSSHNLNMIESFFQLKLTTNHIQQRKEAERLDLINTYNDTPSTILQQDNYLFYDGACRKFGVTEPVRQFFTKPTVQVKQLESLGFKDIAVFSLETGKEITNKQELVTIQDAWLYYSSIA